MRHARSDYAFIQDSRTHGIPVDEPVFVLRAKDSLAPDTLRYWAAALEEAGGDVDTAEAVREWADEMEGYADEHYGGGKVPDVPEDALGGG